MILLVELRLYLSLGIGQLVILFAFESRLYGHTGCLVHTIFVERVFFLHSLVCNLHSLFFIELGESEVNNLVPSLGSFLVVHTRKIALHEGLSLLEVFRIHYLLHCIRILSIG